MVVRFRRIEDRKESAVQLRRRTEDRRRTRRILPKLALVLLAAILAAGAYLWLRPCRIVAPAVVRVETVELAAPVDGTLSWTIDGDGEDVHRGQVLARIAPDPHGGPAAEARQSDLRIRAAAAAKALTEKQQRLESLKTTLARQEGELGREISRLEGLLAAAQTELRAARSESAARERTRRNNPKPESAVQRATDRATAMEQQRARARRDRAALSAAAAREIEKALEAIAGARREKARVEESIAHHRKRMRGVAEPVPVSAPAGGRILERLAEPGDHLEKGRVFIVICRPATKSLRAYVPARHRTALRRGRPARFYAPGLADPVTGTVKRIHRRLDFVPAEISRGGEIEIIAGIPVDIELDDPATDLLVPRQTGETVIEK